MDEKWFVGTIKSDQNSWIVRALSFLPDFDTRTENSNLIVIKWNYGGDAMPDSETLDKILHFEDAIFDAMESESWGFEAATLTGDGTKEWRIYAQEINSFMEGFNAALVGHQPYPLDLQMFSDPEWTGLSELQTS